MAEDNDKGQAVMKAVIKASLYGLFAIGVRSQANIDRFIVAFTNKFEEQMEALGITQEKETIPNSTPLPPTNTPVPPAPPPLDADIKVLKLHPQMAGSLRKANINTVEQLVAEMQKRPLTEIKGIKERGQEMIREAVKKYGV